MSQENLVTPENNATCKLPLRQKVAFYLEDTESSLGLWIDLTILGLILLSSIIFVVQTYQISQQLQHLLGKLDLIIIIVFTLEYIIRCWSADKPLRFIFSFLGLIDLISILPLLLGLIDIRFFRVFRWFRILRIVRFWQIEKRFFPVAIEDSVVFIRIFLTLFTLIYVYTGLIYQVEHQINSDRLVTFFDAFYFVVVTMTTVGYGDVIPLSQTGKFMTVFMIFTGVLFIPWQLSELIGQVVKTSSLINQECPNCRFPRHEPDALFCKKCGTKLNLDSNN